MVLFSVSMIPESREHACLSLLLLCFTIAALCSCKFLLSWAPLSAQKLLSWVSHRLKHPTAALKELLITCSLCSIQATWSPRQAGCHTQKGQLTVCGLWPTRVVSCVPECICLKTGQSSPLFLTTFGDWFAKCWRTKRPKCQGSCDSPSGELWATWMNLAGLTVDVTQQLRCPLSTIFA